jgi:hypothetical protein
VRRRLYRTLAGAVPSRSVTNGGCEAPLPLSARQP